jgi:hypothetical protein
MVDSLVKVKGLNKTSVVETAIREMAKREGIK